MLKFYPAEIDNDGDRKLVRGPPRPLPHFYVGSGTRDPSKTATTLKERNDAKRSSGGAKTPRSCRENSQPKRNAAE
jgi:hypothetical protein